MVQSVTEEGRGDGQTSKNLSKAPSDLTAHHIYALFPEQICILPVSEWVSTPSVKTKIWNYMGADVVYAGHIARSSSLFNQPNSLDAHPRSEVGFRLFRTSGIP